MTKAEGLKESFGMDHIVQKYFKRELFNRANEPRMSVRPNLSKPKPWSANLAVAPKVLELLDTWQKKCFS